MQKSLTIFLLFVCLMHLPISAEKVSWRGKLYDDQTVANMITVITTTNPVPSIPTTKHIYPSQKSLFRIPAFALCKKIIVFDGIQPGFENRAQDYEEYKKAITALTETDHYFSNTELIFCDKWVHLAGAIREAMAHVTTPYVFIHQHDFVLIKDFDLNGLIATMEANPGVKHVRLALPRVNWHWSNPPPSLVDEDVRGMTFVPLCRHFQWSDNDHVTTKEYYTQFVLPQCEHGPMELYLDSALQKMRLEQPNEFHPIFGTYLYGDINDGGYLHHSNGRDD